MTRSKMNESRRRRQRQGKTPAVVRNKETAITSAEGSPEPAQWSRRCLVILGGSAFALHVLTVSIRIAAAKDSYLVAVNDLLFMIATFLVAEPVVRTFSRAPRKLRFGETLSIGAMTAVVSSVLYTLSVALSVGLHSGRGPDSRSGPWNVAATAMVAISFLVVPVVFPAFRRRFLTPSPRRRKTK